MKEIDRHSLSDLEPRAGISRAQQAQFELIRLAMADFNGEQIVADLEAHAAWWRGAIIGNFESQADLLALRDVASGFWNADTLMLLTTSEHAHRLAVLVCRWGADDVRWLEEAETARRLGRSAADGLQVLQVRWD